MPTAYIVKETKIIPTFRTSNTVSMFNMEPQKSSKHEWTIDIPIEDKTWNIGIIAGTSGSGKTTIAEHFWKIQKEFAWDENKSILDSFPEKMETKQIIEILSSVGFSSPPDWLKPFHILSNGQKFRVNLARSLAEAHPNEICVIDEFSSVVNREAAQIGSHAFQKIARKLNLKFILLSCHYDIVEWLEPDWILNMNTQEFKFGRTLQRPKIILQIFKCRSSLWRIFRQHHYLDTSLHKAAQCFTAVWKDQPVSFSSFIPVITRSIRAKRGHRTVCLPDFQGTGIGKALNDFTAEYCRKKGFRFISVTSHPAFARARMKDPKWKLLSSGIKRRAKDPTLNKTVSSNRYTYTFEYLGEKHESSKNLQ